MDYRSELKRVEGLIRKGRIRQLFLPTVLFLSCVLSGLASPSAEALEGLEGGLATAFFLCPIAFYFGYGEFAPFEEILYDGNAPRSSFFKRYWMKWPGRGRAVLKQMKAYREELLMKVGGTQIYRNTTNNASYNDGRGTVSYL